MFLIRHAPILFLLHICFGRALQHRHPAGPKAQRWPLLPASLLRLLILLLLLTHDFHVYNTHLHVSLLPSYMISEPTVFSFVWFFFSWTESSYRAMMPQHPSPMKSRRNARPAVVCASAAVVTCSGAGSIVDFPALPASAAVVRCAVRPPDHNLHLMFTYTTYLWDYSMYMSPNIIILEILQSFLNLPCIVHMLLKDYSAP